MGFRRIAIHRTKHVQVWQQGEARLVLNRAHPITGHHRRGEISVSVVGVEDQHALRSAARAQSLLAPQTPRALGAGETRLPALTAPDGTSLYFCRTSPPDAWLVDFETRPLEDAEPAVHLIDHVALSPTAETFDETLLFYRATFGLEFSTNEEIADPHGLVRSRAVAGEHFRLIFNVPVFGSDHEPPGLQHIAFSCQDIFATALKFRAADVPTLPIPQNYYNDLAARTDLPPATIDTMRDHGILYDHSPAGAFYHLYTTMLGPGLFFEVVQRIGDYTGFGAPNAPIRRAVQA
jgi:4-hydroxyphenylpyruvate dioxygenase